MLESHKAKSGSGRDFETAQPPALACLGLVSGCGWGLGLLLWSFPRWLWVWRLCWWSSSELTWTPHSGHGHYFGSA